MSPPNIQFRKRRLIAKYKREEEQLKDWLVATAKELYGDDPGIHDLIKPCQPWKPGYDYPDFVRVAQEIYERSDLICPGLDSSEIGLGLAISVLEGREEYRTLLGDAADSAHDGWILTLACTRNELERLREKFWLLDNADLFEMRVEDNSDEGGGQADAPLFDEDVTLEGGLTPYDEYVSHTTEDPRPPRGQPEFQSEQPEHQQLESKQSEQPHLQLEHSEQHRHPSERPEEKRNRKDRQDSVAVDSGKFQPAVSNKKYKQPRKFPETIQTKASIEEIVSPDATKHHQDQPQEPVKKQRNQPDKAGQEQIQAKTSRNSPDSKKEQEDTVPVVLKLKRNLSRREVAQIQYLQRNPAARKEAIKERRKLMAQREDAAHKEYVTKRLREISALLITAMMLWVLFGWTSILPLGILLAIYADSLYQPNE